jgi:non-ribosomal peptide synthetase component E (peptide arylation enzyme)
VVACPFDDGGEFDALANGEEQPDRTVRDALPRTAVGKIDERAQTQELRS